LKSEIEDWNVKTMAHNLRTMESNVSTISPNMRTKDRNFTPMDHNPKIIDLNVPTMNRSLSGALYELSTYYTWISLDNRIHLTLLIIQAGYYPILAIVGVPGKSLYPSINETIFLTGVKFLSFLFLEEQMYLTQCRSQTQRPTHQCPFLRADQCLSLRKNNVHNLLL